MDASSILESIAEHRRALADLNARVEDLLASVDAATAEAREVLSNYQHQKRLASESLGEASRRFGEARRTLRQANDLLRDLAAVKQEHVRVSGEANRFIASRGDIQEAGRVHREASACRCTLRDIAAKIERSRQAAHLAEAEDESSAPDEL